MNNELKEMLESVIHEAFQPLHERFDRLEERLDILEERFDILEAKFGNVETAFDDCDTFTRSSFAGINSKLDSILEMFTTNNQHLLEMNKLLAMNHLESSSQIKSINTRLDELTLDVKVLKKAI